MWKESQQMLYSLNSRTLQQRHGGPDGPDDGAARRHPQRRRHVKAALGDPVGAGIAFGHADGLIHQLLLVDPRAVAAENEDRLFKDLRRS